MEYIYSRGITLALDHETSILILLLADAIEFLVLLLISDNGFNYRERKEWD